jgi:hypothetical protein
MGRSPNIYLRNSAVGPRSPSYCEEYIGQPVEFEESDDHHHEDDDDGDGYMMKRLVVEM